MSAPLIAKIRARLSEFHDGTSLVHQLVGSHAWRLVRLTDSASESSKIIIRNATRQLLVKLKVIFDHQLSFFALRDFGYSLSSARLTTPDREFCFEATLYTLFLGADLENPSTLGRHDYSILRGLAFASLLAVFRALCLHRTSFAEHEVTLILQRLGHLCQVWESQEPLSMVEALILRRLLPQTLDNIRLHEGNSMIQIFCCGKCDQRSYPHQQAVVCIDPWSPQSRINALHCCHDLVQASILVIDEISCIDAFWTLHDVNWALMDTTVQGARIETTDGPRFASVKAATRQLWERLGTLSNGLGSGTFNSHLCSYFQNVARYLGEDGDFLFPALFDESNDFQSTINDDLIDFERELARLGSPETDTGCENLPPEEARATPPVPRPFSYEFPRQQSEGRKIYPEILHVATRKTSVQSASPSVSEQSFIDKMPSPKPAADIDSQATTNDPLSPSSSNGQTAGFSPHSAHSSSWHSMQSGQSTFSSHRRQWVSSPLSTTPSSPQPQLTRRDSSTPPTIIKPLIDVDSGLQVVEENEPEAPAWGVEPSPHPPDSSSTHHMGIQPQVSTRTSTPSDLSYKESTKKIGFFRFKKRSISSAHSTDRSSLPQAQQMPQDLCFCFSVVGTALLMWTKRHTDYVVKLILPFHNGQKLSLSHGPGSRSSSTWDANCGIKLVGAGNHLVAVVVSQDKAHKLCCFDKYGQRSEIQLPDPNLLPTAVSVSRDDGKIAICCGGTVLVYELVEGLPKLAGSVPAHSKGSNLPSNRRLQQANFSLDSTILVTATQEYHGSEKSPYQVHVRLWRCLSGSAPVLEIELDPVVLDLGYGNDPGLSGIFCSIDHANPMNSRVFLAAQTAKTYDYILMLSREQKNKRILLNEKSIGAVAQGSTNTSAAFFGGQYVFKSGRHDLHFLDVRTGVTQPLASFASERSGLKLDQEAMAVAFPHEALAFAFWRSRKGELILKQVDLSHAAGRPGTIHTLELTEVFHRVSTQG
ncbi:hypothetical protein V8F20_011729 [Naviculisporaceae sp. PSN 640]